MTCQKSITFGNLITPLNSKQGETEMPSPQLVRKNTATKEDYQNATFKAAANPKLSYSQGLLDSFKVGVSWNPGLTLANHKVTFDAYSA